MMKHLMWLDKAIPTRLVAIAGLIVYFAAYSAPAVQKCDCPCAKDKIPATVSASPTGQVTILWPRQENFLARTFHSKVQVLIDSAVVGAVDFDSPLNVNVPNGPHKLAIKNTDDWLENIRTPAEIQIMVSAQKPLFFQVVDKGVTPGVDELDPATAFALLSGDRSKLPSGPGTIYLYWPKSSLSIGFLDSLNTDLPVLLDGKRIGTFTNGDYVVVKAPAGEHTLSVDMNLLSGPVVKQNVIIGGGSTRYFHLEKRLDFHIIEDSQEEAAEFTKKSLRQREVSAQ